MKNWIEADWPQITGIKAGTTLRMDLAHIRTECHLPAEPLWLTQVHGIRVLALSQNHIPSDLHADGSFTDENNTVCVVRSADCLPILCADRKTRRIMALHAGWRGLAQGIIEEGFKHFANLQDVQVWLGPAISGQVYEVGIDVYDAFLKHRPKDILGFIQVDATHWHLDMVAVARDRLMSLGVKSIHGGEYCTYQDKTRFYSYRRDGQTGRMATFIFKA